MAANTNPIFILTPRTSFITASLTANTSLDMTVGTSASLFIAGASGSRIDEIRIAPMGSNAATLLRFFLNNGSTTTTVANNSLMYEVACPLTTVSQVAAQTPFVMKSGAGSPSGVPSLPDNGLILAANYKVYVTTATVATGGFAISAIGGDY